MRHLLSERWIRWGVVFVGCALGASAFRAEAQGPPPGRSVDASLIHQFDADLDQDEGSFRRTRVQFGFRQDRRLDGGRTLGVGLSYALDRFDFSGAFDDPWETVHRAGLSLSLQAPLGGPWSGMIMPSVDFAGESGAKWSEAVRGGGIVSVSRRLGERLVIGLGVGAFAGLEETDVLPVALIRWQISARWALGNPFRPGPTGPAGLELSYQPTPAWSGGVGSVYRSNRFRLDEDGSARDGIAETDGLIAFVRGSRAWISGLTANFYAGAWLAGELTVEDDDGRRLSEQDFDAAPLLAVSLRAPW